MNVPWKSLKLATELIVLLTLIVYLPATRAGFVWDDNEYVIDNRTLRSADGLRQIWLDPDATVQYYPLTFSVFWIEYHLWGLRPFGYHVVNVLLQAATALLLWRLLSSLRVPGAWWAAAVFALHPVHVMSVALVTELKNVLSGPFFLAALLLCVRFFGLDADRTVRPVGRKWSYGLAVGLYVCALLAKTSTSILPVALLLILWWKNGRIRRNELVATVPLFVVGILFGAFTLWLEKYAKGAIGSEFALPFLDRFLVAGHSFWFCLGKLLWPTRLTFLYPRWQIDSTAIAQYSFPLAAIALLAALWWTRPWIGRAPLAAMIYFLVAFPALIMVEVLYGMRFSFVSDHWQYLGSLSVIPLVVAGAVTAVNRLGQPFNKTGPLIGTATLLTLGLLTWRQTSIYHDAETLWRDTLRKNTGSWIVYNNLGTTLSGTGRISEAIELYEQAQRLKPGDPEVCYNWGNALVRQGNLPEAILKFQQALRTRPNDVKVRTNLGNALVRQGKVLEAIAQFEQGLKVDPKDVRAHNSLGRALFQIGKASEAIRQFDQALHIDPKDVAARSNLGFALSRQGKASEAIVQYRIVLQQEPEWVPALSGLAWILATDRDAGLRDGPEAVRLAERLCEITSYKQPDALDILAAAYAETARYSDATRIAQDGVDLAKTAGQGDLARRIQERLKFYQSGHPYREGPTSPP